ncbi:hypothetical protein BHM03_00022199 [Ensete ventricosum]|nr:hypothetical protein BHM03_00022199 [Ensete ventricosum]
MLNMRVQLLRRAHLLARHLRPLPPPPKLSASVAVPFLSTALRPFSSPSDSQTPPPPSESSAAAPPASVSEAPEADPPIEDVSNAELKRRLEKYYEADDEEALGPVFEAILARRLSGKHEETDDELMEELRMAPLSNVKDREFESDFEALHDTDEEIDNLYNAREYVEKKLKSDEFFNMDDRKWDDMIKEATEKGFLKDTKECEDILEDMLNYDKLLPEFEDEMVLEYAKIMEAEQPPEEDAIAEADENTELDDPPGEGPILRWESRVVFAPGGDAWHPQNRKVKLSVTVKELGLSRHAFRRLREVVGKRYNPGKDELTITSERFEHREENRKDCLRTLYALIEDAAKADKLVEESRNSYVKDRLKANLHFMERLKAKTSKSQVCHSAA